MLGKLLRNVREERARANVSRELDELTDL